MTGTRKTRAEGAVQRALDTKRAVANESHQLTAALAAWVAADRGRRPRVLIIDDDPLWRGGLRDQIGATCDVDVCARAAEALTLLATTAFDAVVVDLLLPDAPGPSVVAALRARSLRPLVPVVTISSLDPEEARAIAARAGATEHVDKGAGFAGIATAIQRLLRA